MLVMENNNQDRELGAILTSSHKAMPLSRKAKRVLALKQSQEESVFRHCDSIDSSVPLTARQLENTREHTSELLTERNRLKKRVSERRKLPTSTSGTRSQEQRKLFLNLKPIQD